MRDGKFIELVNLYLDREISSAEAALLEEEIRSNSARRLIFDQYSRIQRASLILAETFQDESHEEITRIRRRSRPRLVSYAAGGVAAACFSFVLVNAFVTVSLKNKEQTAAQGLAEIPLESPKVTAAAAKPLPQAIPVRPPARVEFPTFDETILSVIQRDVKLGQDWVAEANEGESLGISVEPTAQEILPAGLETGQPRARSFPIPENASFQFQR